MYRMYGTSRMSTWMCDAKRFRLARRDMDVRRDCVGFARLVGSGSSSLIPNYSKLQDEGAGVGYCLPEHAASTSV